MADAASDSALLSSLAVEVADLSASHADLERNCWLVVHRHRHGVFPSEYDIREIDEDLYLTLLAHCRSAGSSQP